MGLWQRGPAPLRGCSRCRMLVRTDSNTCPYCGGKLLGSGGDFWKRLTAAPGAVTWALIAVCGVIFLLEVLLQQKYFRNGGSVLSLAGISGFAAALLGSNWQLLVVEDHQYWRLLTSCFLHFGLLHIVFNCMALHTLGLMAEQLWGARKYFVSYIICGIAGSVGSLLYFYVIRGIPANSAGASGAICGLLGMLLGYSYRWRRAVNPQFRSVLKNWLIYTLVFGVMAGADNAAHIGGVLCGGVIGYFLPARQNAQHTRRRELTWSAAAALALLVTLSCMLLAARFCSSELDEFHKMSLGAPPAEAAPDDPDL